METLGIASVASITVIAFLAGQFVKAIKLDSKWIPLICGVVGGVLGVVGLNVMPDFPAADIITAVAVGIVSGLAATGVNELVNHTIKGETHESDGETDESA